mmetsp:Transcript_37957/g.64639  ORF Transcript_37957/g.64639 Transcript_37957/m.64639 type:complete len:118 (+) Transcript_37957:211-564(+)
MMCPQECCGRKDTAGDDGIIDHGAAKLCTAQRSRALVGDKTEGADGGCHTRPMPRRALSRAAAITMIEPKKGATHRKLVITGCCIALCGVQKGTLNYGSGTGDVFVFDIAAARRDKP